MSVSVFVFFCTSKASKPLFVLLLGEVGAMRASGRRVGVSNCAFVLVKQVNVKFLLLLDVGVVRASDRRIRVSICACVLEKQVNSNLYC